MLRQRSERDRPHKLASVFGHANLNVNAALLQQTNELASFICRNPARHAQQDGLLRLQFRPLGHR